MKTFKFIDLFCGLGGFRIALQDNGGVCVFSSDNNKEVCRIYERNFGENPYSDITEVPSSSIPNYDVLCAGFPCQPFSIAGKRLGFDDSRGTLFFEVARIMKDTNPKVAFLENVAGITNHDGGKTIKVILNTLDELGYNAYNSVLNAKDYGVPQNRARWYCVAIRKDLDDGQFRFPDMTSLKYTLDDIIDPVEIEGYRSTEIALENINKHLSTYLNSARYKEHPGLIIANEIRPSKCNFRSDGISPCLIAKMGTGGNNIPVVVKYRRTYTERECLRIMGFPDNYYIEKNKMQSYKQLGNSVVVPLIYEIAKKFIKYVGE